MFEKGDFVKYAAGQNMIRAIVRTQHRDNSYTVEARHYLDETGKEVGAYLGFKFRLAASMLRHSL